MRVGQNDCLASIVTRNIAAAAVFNYYDIDFFSRGGRTLEDACLADNVSISNVMEDLWNLEHRVGEVPDFDRMGLEPLAIYILKNHHRFAESKIGLIKHRMEAHITEFGVTDSMLAPLRTLVADLSVYLTVHMRHEEFVVFPFIRKLSRNGKLKTASLYSVERAVESMKQDHDHEAALFRSIAELTDHYTLPKGGDFGIRTLYGNLQELEEDLRIHMHLENNILFPRALDLTSSLINLN